MQKQNNMHLEIVTPEKKLFTGSINSIKVPGKDGEFEILNNHAPIISSLTTGTIRYSEKSNNKSIEITGGIVEVLNNKVSALIEK